MNKLKITSTKILVAFSIVGLLMAMSATSYGQAIDAAPEVAESASDAPAIELHNDDAAPVKTAEAANPEGSDVANNPASEDPIGTGSSLVQALKDGQWLVAFGFALLLLVFILRWGLAAMKIKWAETKPGGFILAFGTSLALAFGIAFSTGAGFSFALLVGAGGAAWLAAGQHGHIKDVIGWLRGE